MLPDIGGEKTFDLLLESMLRGNKVAIATTILGKKEILAAFIPSNEGMLMRSLYFSDDIREPPSYERPAHSEEEIAAALKLIDSRTKKFEHERFHPEYQMRIKEKINEKIAAQDIITTNGETPQLPFMEAIRKSILSSQNTGAAKKSGKTKAESKKETKPHRTKK